MVQSNRIYSSKIIKAGALLADTKTLLAHWNDTLSVAENLQQFRRENLFGKASRSRIDDILPILRQRYLTSESVLKTLSILVKGQCPAQALARIFYFHAAKADPLLHDAVTDILWQFYSQGKMDIFVEDIQATIRHWVDTGQTTGRWSDYTILRVARGVLSTLRDFGVLEGTVHKRVAPQYLPVEAFAYVAFCLRWDQPSGQLLIADPEWRLFFLSHQAVEHFFMEAHQRRLLEFYAAGSIVRITFPSESLAEYANALLARAP